jgi:asparagine synthase (glutamine-hydrolysing)
MMFSDFVRYLPDDVLVKVDRAAMSASLETRIPLLDRRVIEFAWSLPSHFKQRYGQGKWLLRQVLHRYVPRKLVERPKQGFAAPVEEWIRTDLRPWAEELLDEHRLRQDGFFHHKNVRRKWSEHLSGKGDWGRPLWNVLMFQGWLDAQKAQKASVTSAFSLTNCSHLTVPKGSELIQTT